MHLFSFSGFESDDGSGMIGSLFCRILLQISILYCCFIGKRLVELNDKIVLEVFGNAAAVTGRVADNLVLFGNDLDVRTFVESIYNNIRVIILRKCETEKYGTFRRCHFGDYIVFCQIYFVVIRGCNFSFVCKPACAFLFVKHRLAYYRHNGELAIIVDPRTGLMCLLEAAYLIGSIGILPAITHLSGLRSPEVHSPGAGNSRIGITC